MEWWQVTGWWGWPGWTLIAVTLQAISLVALVIAIGEVYRRWRRVDPVVFQFEVFGTYRIGEDQFHACRLYNLGRSSARISLLNFFNSRAHETASFKFRATLGAGEYVDFLLSAEDIEDAFALFMWHSTENRDLAELMWLPVVDEGRMGEQWREDWDRGRQRWWRRLRSTNIRPVGPNHFTRAAMLVSKTSERKQKIITEALGALLGNPTTISGSSIPANLPYVRATGG